MGGWGREGPVFRQAWMATPFQVRNFPEPPTPGIGQKLKGSSYRGLFSQRDGGSYWCPWGRGLGSGSGGWRGWGFLWKLRGKGEGGGEGGGGGIGTGKGTGKSMRKLCRNYSLAIYPLVSLLWYFSKVSPVEMGGVLQYKLEVCCGVPLSPKKPARHIIVQTSCTGWGFLNSPILGLKMPKIWVFCFYADGC